MDPRLLQYYEQELEYLNGLGAEFAQQYPKIAGRLGMDGIKVADPYVERLLEGCAFLSARVRLKLDAEFPTFTQHLLQMVYPHYLAPTPAMLIAQLHPNLGEPNLAKGVVVPRGSVMEQAAESGDATRCRFRTAHDVTLWPIEVTGAKFFSTANDLPLSMLPVAKRFRSGVRLQLQATAGFSFGQLDLDKLRIYLSGTDKIAFRLYDLIQSANLGALVATVQQGAALHEYLPITHVAAVGFGDDEALLPATLRSFQGYRLLQEYFAFPQRFLSFDVSGLRRCLRRVQGNRAELVLLFEQTDAALEQSVDATHFALYCTPCSNLFSMRCTPIDVNNAGNEFHVVPDRTRPMDFEVHSVAEVGGHGVGVGSEQRFLPFYTQLHHHADEQQRYFTVRRELRVLSERQMRLRGFRSSYVGGEMFLSLVDPAHAPYDGDLRRLSVEALCTNRDLPLQMSLGHGQTDFHLEEAAPVEAIRCIAGPSKPQSALVDDAGQWRPWEKRAGARPGYATLPWRLLSHLSLNYLSLLSLDSEQGAAALRNLLDLYANGPAEGSTKQIEGLRDVAIKQVVRRLPLPGPITYGRGLQINLTVDEQNFVGGSAVLFGAVLERFFQRYVSINSFTETVLGSIQRGNQVDLKQWAAKCGERPII